MEGRRRLTLLDQMSASSNGRALAGLSLDDVLAPASPKQPPPAPAIPASISGRTLLDIIRDEEPKSYKALIGKKDKKKPWNTFKERIRLKKASAAWASSVLVPTSDVYTHHRQLQGYSHSRSRANSIRYVTPEPQPMAEPGGANSTRPTPSFTRRSSVRFASPVDDVDSPRRRLETAISEERSLSAREAVAAQQAAEAEAAAAAAETAAAAEGQGEEGSAETGTDSSAAAEAVTSPPEPEPVRMSLMDLLEETDRQMGLEGATYTMDDEDEEEEEGAAEAEEEEAGEEGGGVEYSCCVCMVRHKGSAFIPCGHTFCRMCSRELWVQRGNCPLCNNYILEILDIF